MLRLFILTVFLFTPSEPVDIDVSRDGVVNGYDLFYFRSCVSGSNIPYLHDCGTCDFDGDGDVDVVDWGYFQRAMSAPEYASRFVGYGDVNGDGVVDVRDVEMISQAVHGPSYEWYDAERMDLNYNGVPDQQDIDIVVAMSKPFDWMNPLSRLAWRYWNGIE